MRSLPFLIANSGLNFLSLTSFAMDAAETSLLNEYLSMRRLIAHTATSPFSVTANAKRPLPPVSRTSGLTSPPRPSSKPINLSGDICAESFPSMLRAENEYIVERNSSAGFPAKKRIGVTPAGVFPLGKRATAR